MDIKRLCEPLSIDQIDFRVQSINRGGYATILAYKDARVDMDRLDSVCGALWKREHSRDNKNCTISIYNKDISEWVGREDTGSESMADAQKGLASDSFKRAGTNWGIGRELYDYPIISVKLNGGGNDAKNCEWYFNEKKKDNWGNPKPAPGYDFKLKDWVWCSQFTGGKISYLAAKYSGQLRFSWGEHKK
jgi:hypothetical protein